MPRWVEMLLVVLVGGTLSFIGGYVVAQYNARKWREMQEERRRELTRRRERRRS